MQSNLKKVVFTGELAADLWKNMQDRGKIFDDKYFVDIEINMEDLSKTIILRKLSNEDATSFMESTPKHLQKYIKIENDTEESLCL